MGSKSTPPAKPDSLATMFQNPTFDTAQKSESNNNARDTFKIVQNNSFNREGENYMPEIHDAINYLLNVVPHFLEEVRKNDPCPSTAGETVGKDISGSSDPVPQTGTTDYAPHPSILEYYPAEIIDRVPPSPSSLPVANIADRYTRSMLKCLLGYPLYNPKPFSELSKEYPRNGVNIGDVGYVRGSGTFDFLFNICPLQNGPINPPNLPEGFSLEIPNQSATTVLDPLPRNTRLFQTPITKTRSGEYICEGSEGAVLELPKGAIQHEATNTRPFEKLAARHAVKWYEYTMNRGRSISNGSLYLITSVTKCTQWGIAVFDRPCAPGQGLRFDKRTSLPFVKSTSKYRWKGSDTFHTKVADSDQGDAANQCVFVRGYKIMIRQDIFDNLCNDQPHRSDSVIPLSSSQVGSSNMTRQRATPIRGGGGPDPVSRLAGAGLLPRTTIGKSDEEVVLHPNFNSTLVHPSDPINAALLGQNPGAQVALMHDDVWCNLLRDNFPNLNYATLLNIARSYTTTIEYDCVSLEKISDANNVLEEHSHLLQRTEAPALQGPLTPPNDDHTTVPATISLTFPRELVERILLLLDTKAMLRCRLVSREFSAIIQSSTLVQYYLTCRAAGVVDNPRSPLSYAERLEALKKREEAWRNLTPVFETTISAIDHPSRSVFEVSAGNYFRSDRNYQDMYYCHLPSSPQDNPEWFRIPGHGPEQSGSGSIRVNGMAIYEHDLLVNVISSEIGNQADMQLYSLYLVLLKFSTGEYHPHAHHHLIHVQRSPSARPYITVRIVGDNLALILCDQDGSKLFIFDWKTGHKRLEHKATGGAYDHSVPVFVSPRLLLVPNRILSHFEVWHLFPSDPNPPVQILSLQLPAVSVNHSIIHIRCHGEFTPFLDSMPYFPPRPFFLSPENSIIVVNLFIGSLLGPRSAYKLIMHRSTLLDMIRKWTSPSLLEQQRRLLTWLTNDVTVHQVADPDDGSVRLDARSESVSTMPHHGSTPLNRDSSTLVASPNSLTSHISTHSNLSSIPSASSSITRYDIRRVQWADWGPPISRWLNGTDTYWINQSAGQRCVFLDPNPRDKRKYMFAVADFNLRNIRKNAEMMAQLRGKEGEDYGGNGNNGERKKEENEEKLDHEGVFSEEVYMGLKCVVHHAPGEYDFDVALMDEERFLMLKFDRGTRTESIKVLYFG